MSMGLISMKLIMQFISDAIILLWFIIICGIYFFRESRGLFQTMNMKFIIQRICIPIIIYFHFSQFEAIWSVHGSGDVDLWSIRFVIFIRPNLLWIHRLMSASLLLCFIFTIVIFKHCNSSLVLVSFTPQNSQARPHVPDRRCIFDGGLSGRNAKSWPWTIVGAIFGVCYVHCALRITIIRLDI